MYQVLSQLRVLVCGDEYFHLCAQV